MLVIENSKTFHLFFCLLLVLVTMTSCAQKKKYNHPSTVKPVFAVDSASPEIPSGFYLGIDDETNAHKRTLHSFESDGAADNREYLLSKKDFISFANIDSVTWMEDTMAKNGFFVLNFSLDNTGTVQLRNYSANAETIRVQNQQPIQFGTVINNTLVQVVNIGGTINNGKMELSSMFNQKDVEILKANFDAAIRKEKAHHQR